MAELTEEQRRALEAAQQRVDQRQKAIQAATARIQPPAEFEAPQPGRFEATEADTGQKIKLAAGYFLNSSVDARKDMLQNILGDDVAFEQDPNGREVAVYGNERKYINPPGLDMGDALDFVGDVVKFAPAAKIATWAGGAGKLLGITRSAIAGGLASGATQAGSDIASKSFGSEQGVDPVGVGLAAAGGALGEFGAPLFQRFRPGAQQLIDKFRNMGINLKATPGEQVGQVQQVAGRMASAEEGAGISQVAGAVRQAERAEHRTASAAMELAQKGTATIEGEGAKEFASRAMSKLDTFDLGAPGMESVSRRVRELQSIAEMDQPFRVRLNNMERWRARVSQMSPKDGSPAQAASRRLTQEYDNWLDDMFNSQMVKGDAQDIKNWTDGRRAWAAYKQRFNADRTISNLASKETTPEQMSAWLFNSSAVGARKEAGQTVQRLNDILGKDSPQMAALRGDVILDLSEPLLRDTPDIVGFVNNYQKFFARNPSLKKELFPGDYGKDLDDFMRVSKAISRRPGAKASDLAPTDLTGRFIGFFNRLVVGHGIARGGARVQATGGLASALRNQVSGPAARRRILEEMLGEWPKQPLLPVPAAGVGAATALQERQE